MFANNVRKSVPAKTVITYPDTSISYDVVYHADMFCLQSVSNRFKLMHAFFHMFLLRFSK